MINKVNFGLRLKQLRERKRLSQIELANILEVSNGSISKEMKDNQTMKH